MVFNMGYADCKLDRLGFEDPPVPWDTLGQKAFRDHEGHEDIQGKEETEASRVLRGSRVQKEWMETRDRMDQLASRENEDLLASLAGWEEKANVVQKEI
ncbi:hypothetical protein GUITHDRAFT_114505 [Guillardia theta CCMP2712]|uniref:Uncharacterized protein n=1 Tax=Guillardia theta (strain CCMP2712) TaxID=905079 RepID=L1ISS6_GUITC|nr:hypothetical protein GUITHDRAFT_114505 [Guillardia theta CCMP2712]EKX39301.1 hypothetical protein GUITHDRAFT_114505 [Guillardia theta CCMP2712]|eukprot:XP_005826281.1 hypothetical protein GUITHDRAFT_114505 [Guillardia theta CCMP2712]